MTDLVTAGKDVMVEATRLWNLGIYDPPVRKAGENGDRARCRKHIDEFIRSPLGLGWGKWMKNEYEGDGMFEWCGAFAARCWSKYLPLNPTRYVFFASTHRLVAWARYHDWHEYKNPEPATSDRRLCVRLDEKSTSLPPGVVPQAGDILIVGGVNTGPGKHVTLVDRWDGQFFHTIEGNAHGMPPVNWNHGEAWQGVVRWKRRLGLTPEMRRSTYHARWLIRPAPSDLVLA